MTASELEIRSDLIAARSLKKSGSLAPKLWNDTQTAVGEKYLPEFKRLSEEELIARIRETQGKYKKVLAVFNYKESDVIAALEALECCTAPGLSQETYVPDGAPMDDMTCQYVFSRVSMKLHQSDPTVRTDKLPCRDASQNSDELLGCSWI